MVVRRDANVESMGIMAELPPDLSPLQIGTRGTWQGKSFELVGRIRVEWESGSWTEWFAIFAGGTEGWVAESQGFYMVSFQEPDVRIPISADDLRGTRKLKLAGRDWAVTDVKDATCLAGEGELPFEAPPGKKRVGADLTGTDGAFGTIEFERDEEPRLYTGHYAEFDDLQLTNLRPVPGWSAEAPAIRNKTNALNCPKCGAVVNLRAPGQSMAAVCGSCGSIIDTADDNLRLIREADKKVRDIKPQLPIGRRGKLEDTEWEVIGFVRRKDDYAEWAEYLLFNPWRGFRWLVNFSGHWTYIRRVPEFGDYSGRTVNYNREEYRIFAKGKARVVAVIGEFYWKVERGESAVLEDYIAPPKILSKEVYPELKEFTWSQGEYIDRKVVAEAFQMKELPRPWGVYLNQPNKYQDRFWPVLWRAALFLALLIGIQIMTSGDGEREVFKDEYYFHRTDAQPVITTPRFQLDGKQSAVGIHVNAPVNNQWMGIDVDLVNAKTNEVIDGAVTVEHYYGTDSDGSWTEGSQQNETYLPAVPAGEYFLNMTPQFDPQINEMSWKVRVTRGGIFESNFFLGFLALSIYPAFIWWRRNSFEASRWSQSDFTPSGGKNE